MFTPLLPQLSEFVRARLGLHFPAERFADLERGVRSAAAELGLTDASACARWLLATPHSDAEIAALASHLTVGETYFFRDPSAFEALETVVLPEMLNAHTRPLRIWSAACCSGEEAYSLAISVLRAAGPRAQPAAKILATDINPRFLEKAAAGVFGQWSFRGVPEEIRARHFEPAGEGQWKVARALREMITFTPVNLSDASCRPVVEEFGTMDIIFCRNVLMYFANEDARRVAGRLAGALNDGGWLFASAAEASHDIFDVLTRADLEGVSAFRKVAVPPVTTRAPSAVAPPLIARTVATPAPSPARPLQTANPDAGAHYLQGMTLQESGAPEDAAAALRRALYLDPDFILAHFALGNLMLRTDRERDAARSFETARTLLRRLDPGDALPQGDGLTAARLLAILEGTQEASA